MTANQEIYSIWAPAECEWSRWVKPVLFSFLGLSPPRPVDSAYKALAGSIPRAFQMSDTVLVADLPGQQGVGMGLEFARNGYRPIPLYNACPQPNLPPSPQTWPRESILSERETTVQAAIDVLPIISAMRWASDELRTIEFPMKTPPVFLLDSRRKGDRQRVCIGMFDNRSVTLPTDFPSSDFLRERGVHRVIVVQEREKPQFDLGVVLRQWQTGGLRIDYQPTNANWDPQPLALPRPSRLKMLWFWLDSRLGFRRNSSGGYGAIKQGSAG